MINDKAFVPSDILTASNGLTIEVMNTDVRAIIDIMKVCLLDLVPHTSYDHRRKDA